MPDTPTQDSPAEPDISHVNPALEATWFGHPRPLARLFTTEAMERFGFYGLRALLALYLSTWFLFPDQTTNGLYGGYMALVYLTPLVGGLLADRYLGFKRAVKFGAVVMAIGYFILCFEGRPAVPFATIDGQRYAVSVGAPDNPKQQFVIDGGAKLAVKGLEDGSVQLIAPDGAVARTVAKGGFEAGAERSATYVFLMLLGLTLVTIGNGFFKPNISTMVGELYKTGDKRRDAGFTIFYMGINLGSLGSQILCPLLSVTVGWWAGFGLAALGMLFSWYLIQFERGALAGIGDPPVRAGPERAPLIYVLSIASAPILLFLFYNLMNAPQAAPGAGFVGYLAALPLMGKLLFGTFLIAVPAILIWSAKAGTRVEFQMMLAAMTLIVFNVVFWTLFEQAGSSLTLFADRNTDLTIFGDVRFTAGQVQFFNAIFIVLLAPLFAIMWNALARRGLEPGIAVKFAIALIGVGAGFLFLVWGTAFADGDFKVAVWWLAGLYLIHSAAELCISPVGLSMITKLSIARIVGMMMGVWFLSISCAQYVGGLVAQLTSVDTVGGQVTNLKLSLDTYAGVFWNIGVAAMLLGVLLFVISPVLRKWMHGVS